MARIKLLFASFATGIVITAGVFITLLFVRALFKDEASVRVVLWVFGWPIFFLCRLPGLSGRGSDLALALAMGILLDILSISLATYFVLRAIVSRQTRTRSAVPPQPPTF
jgi:hypothetical protein